MPLNFTGRCCARRVILFALLGGTALVPGNVHAQTSRSITIEAPLAGAQVDSPFEVRGRGTPTPFENTLVFHVYDTDGNVLGQGPITVTGQLGGPFAFAASVVYDSPQPGLGWLELQEPNVAGGPPLVSVSMPLSLQSAAPAEETMSPPFMDTAWRWAGLRGPAGNDVLAVGDMAPYTLRFLSSGTYEGQADCNRVAGGYTLNDGDLTLSPGASTLAFCPPPSLSDQFLRLIAQVGSYTQEGDVLVLGLSDQTGAMVFRPPISP